MQNTYKGRFEARSRDHYCVRKAISITHFKCVCSLSYLACKGMRRIILSSVVCLAVPHFSTLCHERKIFEKKVIKHKIWVLIFSTKNVWNIFNSKNSLARYYHLCTELFMEKYLLLLSGFNRTWIFPANFRNILKHQIHDNPSSRSRAVTCWRPAFRYLANAPTQWASQQQKAKINVSLVHGFTQTKDGNTITVTHKSKFDTNATIWGWMTRNAIKALCQSTSSFRHSAWHTLLIKTLHNTYYRYIDSDLHFMHLWHINNKNTLMCYFILNNFLNKPF
jgi:hypothetical protein